MVRTLLALAETSLNGLHFHASWAPQRLMPSNRSRARLDVWKDRSGTGGVK